MLSYIPIQGSVSLCPLHPGQVPILDLGLFIVYGNTAQHFHPRGSNPGPPLYILYLNYLKLCAVML